jgi:hypothetical protein
LELYCPCYTPRYRIGANDDAYGIITGFCYRLARPFSRAFYEPELCYRSAQKGDISSPFIPVFYPDNTRILE